MRTGGVGKRILYKDRIFSNSSSTSPSSLSLADEVDDDMLLSDMSSLGATGRRSNRGINYGAANSSSSRMDDMY